MRDMSRAIRHELAEHGPTLKEIPTEVLQEYVQIVGAFYFDLRDELERRMPGSLVECAEAPPSGSSSS